MNKNKIILGVILAIIVIILALVFQTLSNKEKNTNNNASKISDFSIWIVDDKATDMEKLITEFKQIHPQYKQAVISVESFDSYDEYYYALISAITKGKAPDLFVLNNNEKRSIFEEQAIGIDPKIINPNDFRKKYKGVFADDLILSTGVGEETVEFLKGIPVGYETLGIYFNRTKVRTADLESLSGLNTTVAKLKDKSPNIIPIAMGNGSTVELAEDIITQFFMLTDGVTSLADVTGNALKEGLSFYFLFGDTNGNNAYNSRFSDLQAVGNNNLDLFSKGETHMVVGYPRTILDIEKKGYGKAYLLATPFPHHFSGNGATLLNYNYFVVNKDSKNKSLAYDILSYLTTDSGAEKYLDIFSYYLPALLSLEADKIEDKVHEKYNVVLGDFYNPEYELKSFDKGIKNIYDSQIIPLLDNSTNYETGFNKFKRILQCKTKKVLDLTNISTSCE